MDSSYSIYLFICPVYNFPSNCQQNAMARNAMPQETAGSHRILRPPIAGLCMNMRLPLPPHSEGEFE